MKELEPLVDSLIGALILFGAAGAFYGFYALIHDVLIPLGRYLVGG
jgi:hypothetical protein